MIWTQITQGKVIYVYYTIYYFPTSSSQEDETSDSEASTDSSDDEETDEHYEKPVTRKRLRSTSPGTSSKTHHPWSNKKLKITTEEDVGVALEKLQSKTQVLNKHAMASYAVKVSCPPCVKEHFEPIYTYRGPRAEEKFVQLLAELQGKIESLSETEGQKPMQPLTEAQKYHHETSNICHICDRAITYKESYKNWQTQCSKLKEKNDPIKEKDGSLTYENRFRPYFKSELDKLGPGVMDHCHWTGKSKPKSLN